MRNSGDGTTFFSIDWSVILIYLVLVFLGLINIYAAVYDENTSGFFDLSQRSGVQLIWIGISVFIAASILLIEEKYYHILAYPLYWLSILALLGMFVFGKEVNGAKVWYEIGPIRIQPVEFVKFTASLAIARAMSSYSFSIHNLKSLFFVFTILFLPAIIIILQNDTGSALVYGAFAFMLFREGFNGWVYIAVFMLITLFILSFIIEPLPLIIMLFIFCLLAEAFVNGRWKSKAIYAAGVSLLTAIVFFTAKFTGGDMALDIALIVSIVLSFILVAIYSYRQKIVNVWLFVAMFIGSVGFTYAVDYVFDNVLQVHQQKRILDLLGLEKDLKGWGYNVNQSKIAIGSGGLSGKGYLQGTQTKYDFVPEQSTDFIFCTVGEEWGFIGSAIVVILFVILIVKLISMGERQEETFGRIYCYCVASVFFFHFIVNVGMTIGLMPVIGIPLPFFSYGGSSMLAFTMLLFVAIKLDSSRKNHISRI
ncbi:MAG: rod shape-determining protein RodA [Rikenellaceae bacterium]|nr:rod shape-determining protein RodA [Rikenellaceae bacterium]